MDDKKISQDEVKTFVKSISSLKPTKFHLRAINKLSDK